MGGRSLYNSRLLHLLEYTVTSPRHRQPFLVFLYRLVNNSSEERQRLGPMMEGERIMERFSAEAGHLSPQELLLRVPST